MLVWWCYSERYGNTKEVECLVFRGYSCRQQRAHGLAHEVLKRFLWSHLVCNGALFLHGCARSLNRRSRSRRGLVLGWGRLEKGMIGVLLAFVGCCERQRREKRIKCGGIYTIRHSSHTRWQKSGQGWLVPWRCPCLPLCVFFTVRSYSCVLTFFCCEQISISYLPHFCARSVRALNDLSMHPWQSTFCFCSDIRRHLDCASIKKG